MMHILKRILLLIFLLTAGQVVGQDFNFRVKYGMIQAGTARIRQHIEDGILISNLHIKSSPWLTNLWSLSDSIKSVYEIESGRLLSHTKAIHEGSYHRNYKVFFVDSNRVSINGKERVLDTQSLRDIPSLLFDLSRMNFINGDTLQYRLWDGQSFGILDLLVERIAGPSLFHPFAESGWRLTPLSSNKKSRENRIQLALLLSGNQPHRPLRIEIDTKYGNILMRLETP